MRFWVLKSNNGFFSFSKVDTSHLLSLSTAILQQSTAPQRFSHNILDEGCCPVSLYIVIALVYSVFWEISASKYQICIHLLLFLYKPWPNLLYTRNALEITVYFYFRLSKRLREKSTTWINVFISKYLIGRDYRRTSRTCITALYSFSFHLHDSHSLWHIT